MTLAYAFHKNGQFDFKLLMSKDSDDIRNGRILSTQGHFEALLQTESRFDIPDYGDVNPIKKIELYMDGQKMFKGSETGELKKVRLNSGDLPNHICRSCEEYYRRQ